MNLKALLAAAALTFAPMMASAATFMSDGDTFTIGTGGDDIAFFGDVEAGLGGAGSWSVSFDSNNDPLSAEASATIGNIVFSQFSGLMMSWISNFDNEVLATSAITPLITNLSTVFKSPEDLSQRLVISWTDSSENAAFDVEVAATVPLPAGILLMGTALAGFGVMRRRKEAA